MEKNAHIHICHLFIRMFYCALFSYLREKLDQAYFSPGHLR